MNTDTTTSPEQAAPEASTDPRALTIDNVERVLDELRPYLMADGGNVEIVAQDGHRAQAAGSHSRGHRSGAGALSCPVGCT